MSQNQIKRGIGWINRRDSSVMCNSKLAKIHARNQNMYNASGIKTMWCMMYATK